MKKPSKTTPIMAKTKTDAKEKVLSKNFKTLLKEPEQFLGAQPEKFNGLCKLLEQLYKEAINADEGNAKAAEILPELVVEEMQEEQIWQQLELRNDVVLQQLVEKTAKMSALREEKFEVRLKGEEEEDDEENDEVEMEQDDEDNELEDDDDNDDDDNDDDDDEEEKDFKMQPKRKVRSSIVDDKFFKLGEMEAFLEAEDAKEMRKQDGKRSLADDDGIDYFADNFGDGDDDDEDEDDENPDYKDFFDMDQEDEALLGKANKKKKEKDHFAEEEEDEKDEDNEDDEDDAADDDDNDAADEELNIDEDAEIKDSNLQPDSASDSEEDENKDEDKPKSSFEMRQERLEQRIRDYEDEVLGEKPWQLKGEIQATNRPQNSLLEEVLEFESTTRPAPVITEETTRCLEDIIRQRIKDQAWDDVELKIKPTQSPHEYRKKLVLDQEKSKQSLAQIYEREYQAELDKLDPNRGDAPVIEPKEHTEIRRLMTALFGKLDALTNFHFTPKPVAPEAKIITNTPAISMEEVAPLAVSDATLLAPEEVLKRSKNAPLGVTDRTKTDKNRERRQKKQKQRAVHKALEAKDVQRQKLGIPLSKKEEGAKLLKNITKHRNVEKITVSNDQGSLKSSKAFFSKLQDTTTSLVPAKGAKKKPNAQALNAKKLKL